MTIGTLLLGITAIVPSATVEDRGLLHGSTVSALLSRHGLATAPPSPDIQLESLTYASVDLAGRPVTLSGLIAVPQRTPLKGWVLYFHSTTTERENVPSRLRGDGGPGEAQFAVAAFADDGYGVFAPDYLGLGDSDGVHPYARSSFNCRAGLDMVAPVADEARRRAWPVPPRLFITGYSEGGGVAMWAAKTWRPVESMSLVAAAPMCGAYDMSGVEIPAILAGQSNLKWLGARIFLAAYLGLTFSKDNPAEAPGDIFVPSFASYVPYAFRRYRTDDALARALTVKGLQVGATRSVKRILQPALVRALERRDATNPLVRALLAEDCYDWAPSVPLDLICLARDYLIPPENAHAAQRAMRRYGPNPGVELDESAGPGYDHITFIPKALDLARKFFDRQIWPPRRIMAASD